MYPLSVCKHGPEGSARVVEWSVERMATSTKLKTTTRWPLVGEVPYQALPLLRFFAYKIRAREKVRKGEGEPGTRLAEYRHSFIANYE